MVAQMGFVFVDSGEGFAAADLALYVEGTVFADGCFS